MTCDVDSKVSQLRGSRDNSPAHAVAAPNMEANAYDNILHNRLLLLKDPANFCTFCNCIVGFWALASICHSKFYLAMCLIMLGNILDIIDGRIANATANRHPVVQEFGRMFDPLVEALISNMAPAFVLMHLGRYQIIPVGIAAFFIVVGNFRAGKYHVVGHIQENGRIYYPGIWAEYSLCLLGVIGHLMPYIGRDHMTYIWAFILLTLCYGMLTTRIRSYRYSGEDLKWVLAYCIGLCASYAVMTLVNNEETFVSLGLLFFLTSTILGYPCLFKHIEFC